MMGPVVAAAGAEEVLTTSTKLKPQSQVSWQAAKSKVSDKN